MNNYCIGLLIIVLVYICFQNNDIREGLYDKKLEVPKRAIPKDLQDVLRSSKYGDIDSKGDTITDSTSKVDLRDRYKIYKKVSKGEAIIAKSNFKECEDSGNYHSCNVATPKLESIDTRYLNLPPQELDPSNIYNKLSICPQAYQKNMEKLHKKKIIGQYSGYTRNGYIDRTRYLKGTKEPLPVNPDFFMEGGGVFA
jgi:hypothetical protein